MSTCVGSLRFQGDEAYLQLPVEEGGGHMLMYPVALGGRPCTGGIT
jgi:hypothetical protein